MKMDLTYKYHIVTSERLRDYLYCLGYSYTKQIDQTGRQGYVYLFKNSELLQNALHFFSVNKKMMIELKNQSKEAI